MITLNSSVIIYRPIKQVFDFVSTSDNDFQWQYGTLVAARLPDGVDKLGSFFRSVGHLLGRRNQGIFEVTEYEPNRKYGFKSLSGPLQSFTTFAFDMVTGGSQVKLSMQGNLINMIEFSENILEKKMKRQFKENLTMLKNGLLFIQKQEISFLKM